MVFVKNDGTRSKKTGIDNLSKEIEAPKDVEKVIIKVLFNSNLIIESGNVYDKKSNIKEYIMAIKEKGVPKLTKLSVSVLHY